MAGDGSRAPETMHVRSAGGRESRIPLPASGEAALPDAALFSVPTDQLDSEWNIEIDKPAVYGKCVCGKVRLWSEDGKDGQSILTEKAGATSVARLVRERVVVAMMRRGWNSNIAADQRPGPARTAGRLADKPSSQPVSGALKSSRKLVPWRLPPTISTVRASRKGSRRTTTCPRCPPA